MTDKAKVLETLERLSDDQVREVAAFVDSLNQQDTVPRKGSIEAFMRAASGWWMTPDATERFLIDVEDMRQRENPQRAVPPQY